MFSRYDIPETLISDNGPQYKSIEFLMFMEEYGISRVTSSPRYPMSNGEAERAVQTVKTLLKKSKDPYKSMLAYRSTPLRNGFSPSQLMFGRKLRTSIPIHPLQLIPKWPDFDLVQQREQEDQVKQKADFDRRHGVGVLPKLQIGDKVFVKDPDSTCRGIVSDTSNTPRSYVIQTPSGLFRRNRRMLTKTPMKPDEDRK